MLLIRSWIVVCRIVQDITRGCKNFTSDLSVVSIIYLNKCSVELTYLSESLEMQYEHVRQRPQAELDAALLQLLAVGTAPGIVWGQLKYTHRQSRTSSNHTAYKKKASHRMRPRVLCSLLSIPLQSDRRQEETTMYMWVCAQNFWFIPNIALGVKYTVKPQRVEDCLNFSRGIISGKRNVRLYFKISSTPTCAKENLRLFSNVKLPTVISCVRICVHMCTRCVCGHNVTCSSLV